MKRGTMVNGRSDAATPPLLEATRWKTGAGGDPLRKTDARMTDMAKITTRILVLAMTFLAVGVLTAHAKPCRTIDTCIPQLRFGETRALRELAAQMLGERGNPQAVPALSAALNEDEGEFVRIKAAEALGRIGTAVVGKPLAAALGTDKRELVRASAARALGLLEGNAALDNLITALGRDPSWQVRAASAWALSRHEPNPLIADALSDSLLKDRRLEVRLGAARAIAILKVGEGGPALVRALKEEPHPFVRTAVAKAMIQIEAPGLDEALGLSLREEPDRSVRRQTAETLGRRKKITGVRNLLSALRRDPAIEVRTESATSLGRIGTPEARAALDYYAENSVFPRIRRAARDALEDFQPRKEPKPEPPATSSN